MKIHYYGHACFAVEVAGRSVLFDPYVTPNKLASGVDVKSIKADYILVSHGHIDHVADAVDIAQRTGATLVSNFEITEWFAKKGAAKKHAMNHGGAWNFDFGRVKYTPAIHTSSMPDGAYGGNPGGFLVESKEGNFYYSGDTALSLEMTLVGENSKLNFAALCIGDNYTMGIEDAIKASDLIGCAEILGVHYDTFEEIKINHAEAVEKFRQAGKQLHLPKPGETIELG
jgi:L-ascorbate metabolism protein UlaG (beta-lactamase superfamily)